MTTQALAWVDFDHIKPGSLKVLQKHAGPDSAIFSAREED